MWQQDTTAAESCTNRCHNALVSILVLALQMKQTTLACISFEFHLIRLLLRN